MHIQKKKKKTIHETDRIITAHKKIHTIWIHSYSASLLYCYDFKQKNVLYDMIN